MPRWIIGLFVRLYYFDPATNAYGNYYYLKASDPALASTMTQNLDFIAARLSQFSQNHSETLALVSGTYRFFWARRPALHGIRLTKLDRLDEYTETVTLIVDATLEILAKLGVEPTDQTW